jgi:hypothetical protein
VLAAAAELKARRKKERNDEPMEKMLVSKPSRGPALERSQVATCDGTKVVQKEANVMFMELIFRGGYFSTQAVMSDSDSTHGAQRRVVHKRTADPIPLPDPCPYLMQLWYEEEMEENPSL